MKLFIIKENIKIFLLTCDNTLVRYYILCHFEIINSKKYEVNHEFALKKIPNEAKQRINEQYLW